HAGPPAPGFSGSADPGCLAANRFGSTWSWTLRDCLVDVRQERKVCRTFFPAIHCGLRRLVLLGSSGGSHGSTFVACCWHAGICSCCRRFALGAEPTGANTRSEAHTS